MGNSDVILPYTQPLVAFCQFIPLVKGTSSVMLALGASKCWLEASLWGSSDSFRGHLFGSHS